MNALKIFMLLVLAVLAQITHCYQPYLWLRQAKSAWLPQTIR